MRRILQRSLARRIVLAGIAISIVMGLGLGGASAVIDFRRSLDASQAELDRIVYSAVPQLANSYWQVDTEGTAAILSRLAEHSLVRSLQIEDVLLSPDDLRLAGVDNGVVRSMDEPHLSPILAWIVPDRALGGSRDLVLTSPRDGRPIALLRIELSYVTLYDALGRQAARIVAGTVLQTLLLAAILYLMIRHLIIRPIDTLARIARDQSRRSVFPAESLAPLMPPARHDEIAALARELANSDARQERYREHLEDEVALRTQELVTARNDALAASRVKSAFLANMSHELRTPLNVITGLSEVILRAPLPQGTLRHVTDMRSAARQLLGSIDDVLDLSKLEAGHMTFDARSTAPEDVFDEVISQTRALLDGRPVALTGWIAADFPPRFTVDAQKLSQILLNLTGNAAKFTAEGQIRLVVAVHGARMRLRVGDTGIGIAPDRLTEIFEPFVQADTSTARTVSGTGLGLSIARQMAAGMGGSLKARSIPGRGSVFVLDLPLHPEAATLPAIPHPATDDPRLARMIARLGPPAPDARLRLSRDGGALLLASAHGSLPLPPALTHRELRDAIGSATGQTAPRPADRALAHRSVMIVEDRPMNRQVLENLLAIAGAQVISADGGEEALALLSGGAALPDAIIVDLHMPRLDGQHTLRLVRRLGLDVPVIASSADVSVETREACRAAGFAAFLPKPVGLESLTTTLRDTIEQASPTLDHDALARLSGGDDRLAQRWLALLPPEIATWRRRLHKAPDAEDYHAICGSARQVGARDLARLTADPAIGPDRVAAAIDRLEAALPPAARAAPAPPPDLADCLLALDAHDMRGLDLALALCPSLPPAAATEIETLVSRLDFTAAAKRLRALS